MTLFCVQKSNNKLLWMNERKSSEAEDDVGTELSGVDSFVILK